MDIQLYFKKLISTSCDKRIEDIFILPEENKYVLKAKNGYGIIFQETLKTDIALKLINYCKYISGMSLSEKRRPQVGSISDQLDFFLRISTVGNFQNEESMVIRIIYALDNKQITYKDDDILHQIIKNTDESGLIIFAGKTGSGKTTSVYKIADEIAKNKMIMSIEDPVEIRNKSFLQLQVNDIAGMDYDELIKVGLRHRPDVFIIGEIRDAKTANAAIRAALSGHLVLTTIHARSCKGVINRLIQLGCEYSDVKSSLNTIVYQRMLLNDDGDLMADLEIINNEN
ncbi:MAG: Flp pilus assembly complex ATPase component TadA [Apilactobacillus sp.]|uniref:competence type IV pilus ATPase ComGA n=1 Tax=Apilactobacillus TaxID=2767877 RepID=UPI0025F254E6|nr:competence type IV pilus ATPase ComGA [Apilactobacillus sp.]MCT6822801.1 Flp pilus assembly complex ATPase component TadA [Apilactobacillus sp.]MCT6857865.1 Flp pilus assembly complex ATPase component TadA [Apilactobacillus sp.]